MSSNIPPIQGPRDGHEKVSPPSSSASSPVPAPQPDLLPAGGQGLQPPRRIESLGLSETDLQKAHQARSLFQSVVNGPTDDPHVSWQESDLSFAALWLADRIGGPSLQAQRSAGNAESPLRLLNAAIGFLEAQEAKEIFSSSDSPNSAGPDQLARSLRRAKGWIELGDWWRQQAFPALRARRSSRSGEDPEEWRATLEQESQGLNPFKDMGGRMPAPFSIQTGMQSSHRIYLVKRWHEEKPALELWNVGWGSFSSGEGPDGSPRVYPRSLFVFPDEHTADLALQACRHAEAQFQKDKPLFAVLASLTLSEESVQACKKPPQVIEKAKEEGRLLLLGTPVKPQRSGSCVAKGLRLWLQEELGGSQNVNSRQIMAVLDGVASCVLAQRSNVLGAPSSGERQELRAMLARWTADYRWFKAQVNSMSAQERLLRAAALELESVAVGQVRSGAERSGPYQLYLPQGVGMVPPSQTADPGLEWPWVLESLEKAVTSPLGDLDAALDVREEFHETARALWARLHELEDPCPGTASPLSTQTLTLDTLIPLRALAQIARSQGRGRSDGLTRLVRCAVEMLQMVIVVAPRRGADPREWSGCNALLRQIPILSGYSELDSTPLAPPDLHLLGAAADLKEWLKAIAMTAHESGLTWLQESGLISAWAIPDDWLSAKRRIAWLFHTIKKKRADEFRTLDQKTKNTFSLIKEVGELIGFFDYEVLNRYPSHYFVLRRERTSLERRAALLNTRASWGEYKYLRPPSHFAVSSVLSAEAMETPGLGHLLNRLAEQRQPFEFLGEMASWTPPLGTQWPENRLQGNLFAAAGTEAWNRWVDSALDLYGLFERDQVKALRGLVAALLAGFPDSLPEEAFLFLRKVESLVAFLIPHHPELALSLLMVRLQLMLGGLPAAAERPTAESLLGEARIAFFNTYREADWPDLAPLATRWLAFRREAEESSPEQVVLGEMDGQTLELHLDTGLLTGRVGSSRAFRKLTAEFFPKDWVLGTNPQGRPCGFCKRVPGAELSIEADGTCMRVHWLSTVTGKPESALIWNLDKFKERKVASPDWWHDGEPPEMRGPLPLSSDTLLWGESRPPTPDGDAVIRSARRALPGIFQRAPLVLQEGRQQSFGLVKPESVEETVRLEYHAARSIGDSSSPLLRFPDREVISLDQIWIHHGLQLVGCGRSGRVILADLAAQGEPIRATLRREGQETPEILFDNGWRIAPEQRDRLPTWLQQLPGMKSEPNLGGPVAIAPVARGAQRGLLMGKPVSHDPGPSGELIFLNVTQSGDIELDPDTDILSLVALIPHLAAWAPTVLRRLLIAIASSPERLKPAEIYHLSQALEGLRTETGLLLEPVTQSVLERLESPKSAEPMTPLAAGNPLNTDELSLPQGPLQRPAAASPEPDRRLLVDRCEECQRALEANDFSKLRSSLQDLRDRLSTQQREQMGALHHLLTKRLPIESAALAAGLEDFLPTLLMQTWVRAEQAASLEPWRAEFGLLPPDELFLLHQAIGPLVESSLLIRQVDQGLQQVREGPLLPAEHEELAASLGALQKRLGKQLPESLLRQEWLFGLLGRPPQLELLENWREAAAAPYPRQLLVVRMGGGKTSLLNPTIALELAHQAKLDDPRDPAPVFLVVPDNLEEDGRELCARQGWQLMGEALPFLGSQAGGKEVLENARRAAQRGLPLTLTQSAWNFAWLEALAKVLAGPSPADHRVSERISDLAFFNRAAVLLDEADEALAIDQSFNLQTDRTTPLARPLLFALESVVSSRLARSKPLHRAPDEEEKTEWLESCAPEGWEGSRKECAVAALLHKRPLPEDFDSTGSDRLAAMGLLLSAYPAALELTWGMDYGPASASSLDLVPYQSAHWPSDQTFSHPAILGLLTLFQSQQIEFWTSEARVQTLSKLLTEALSADETLAARFEQQGLSAQQRAHPPSLGRLLCDPANLGLRMEVGLFLCASRARIGSKALRIDASGAPLRAQSAVALTGTAPPASSTPTALWEPDRTQAPRSVLLQECAVVAADNFDQIVEQYRPDIIIDPCGLLDAHAAAALALKMASALESQGEKRPLALTWTAGTSSSAPRLQQVLPGGKLQRAPPAEALAIRRKCVVYQQAQCRGTDLRVRAGERGVLFLPAVIPLRDLHQAAARLRGLGQSQTLQIALSPQLHEQITRAQQQQGTSSPIEALEALCLEKQRVDDEALETRLLHQDLTSLEQAAATLLLTQWPQLSIPAQEALQPHLAKADRVWATEFEYPSLAQLAQAEQTHSPAVEREKLQQRKETLLQLLQDLAQQGPPHLHPPLHQLQTLLAKWDERIALLSDHQLLPAEGPDTRSAVVRVQEASQERSEERSSEADLERATQMLRNKKKSTDAEQAGALQCCVAFSEEGGWSGARFEGARIAECGLEGFLDYWQSRGGSNDFLIPPGLAFSTAALQPFGISLPFEDPRRLEPSLLHRKGPEGWSTLVCSPQEAGEMFEQPEWARLAEAGELIITTLAGHPLDGVWMGTPGQQQRAQRALLEPDWQRHLQDLVPQTAALRAFYGAPLSKAAQARHEQIAWLRAQPLWQEVWLIMSPDQLRPSLLSTLSTGS